MLPPSPVVSPHKRVFIVLVVLIKSDDFGEKDEKFVQKLEIWFFQYEMDLKITFYQIF